MTNETMKDGERAVWTATDDGMACRLAFEDGRDFRLGVAFNPTTEHYQRDDGIGYLDVYHDGEWQAWRKAWQAARAASPQSGEKTTFDGVGGIEAAKEAIAAHMRGVTGGDTFTGYVRKELAGDFAVALARAMPPTIVTGVFECAARKQGSAGGNDPADCDWPACGCDEHANRVIAALEESGALNQASTERMSDAAVDAAIEAWFDCDDSNVNDHQARMRRAIIAATKE